MCCREKRLALWEKKAESAAWICVEVIQDNGSIFNVHNYSPAVIVRKRTWGQVHVCDLELSWTQI